MARTDRDPVERSPDALTRKHGMTVLRAPQQRVSQRAAMPSEERALPGAMEIPLDRVVADPAQPRRDWEHDDGERRLEELAASIREFGIIQPLLVREGSIRQDGVQEFIVIAGGRRRAAAEQAGLTTVPVLIRGDEGVRVRVLQLLENLQRQQLSPMDEARAFQELIDIEGLTPPALANRLRLSDQLIRDRLRLLTNQVVADALERKQLNMTAARSLQQLPEDQITQFKERLQRGDEIRHAEIEAHRQRLIAAGVINPRFKGGGRRASRRDAPDQTTFDPPVRQPPADQLPNQQAVDREGDRGIALLVGPPAAEVAPTVNQEALAALPATDESGRVATAAVARALGERLWPYLPETLRASLRDLVQADPSFAWGPSLAEGLGRNVLNHETMATAPPTPDKP